MKMILFVASLLAVSRAHMHIKPIAKATINVGGATGWVKVYGGKVSVMLDLTNFNFSATQVNRSQCRAGIAYHIHANIISAMVGDACGVASGHYDPWFGCGGATANQFCKIKGGCVTRNYSCSPSAFATNPYACEVGDWSGKYGKLTPNANSDIYMWTAPMGNQYEVSSDMLYNPLIPAASSVVFHCTHGLTSPRILCAPFAMDTTMNVSAYAPGKGLMAATTAGERTVADLGSIGGPLVQFGGGQVQVTAGFGGLTGMAGIQTACGSTPINMALTTGMISGSAAQGSIANCGGTAAGVGVWDPTISCVPGSQNGGVGVSPALCQSVASVAVMDFTSWHCSASFKFNYTVAFAVDRYLGAQGALLPWIPLWLNQSVHYRLMNQIPSVLIGKLLTITCGAKAWCAPVQAGLVSYKPQRPPSNATVAPTPRPTSGANRVVVSGAFAIFGLFVIFG